jgi:hypothetical protein
VRLAARMQILTRGLMLATPIGFGVLIAWSGLLALLPLPPGILVDLGGQGVAGLAAITALAALKPAVFFVALWLLHDLFGRYRQGQVFDLGCLRRIGQIGWALVGLDAADFVMRLAAGPLLTALGASEPFLTVGVGLSLSIIGAFVIVIARIMALAPSGQQRQHQGHGEDRHDGGHGDQAGHQRRVAAELARQHIGGHGNR